MSKRRERLLFRVTREGCLAPADGITAGRCREVKWATPDGFPSYVRVSDQGHVFLAKRRIERGHHGHMTLRAILLKPKHDRGYELVQFRLDGKHASYRVHRLVMLAHGEKRADCGVLDVNHLNGCRDDNRIENLEWCSRSENHKHAYRVLSRPNAMAGRVGPNRGMTNHPSTSKKVRGRCVKTGKQVEFPSVKEAARQGFSRDSIAHCLGGRQKTANGYVWSFV